MDRTRVRTRGAKNMRTDADHEVRVRDPAIELLLSHTATLTDEWCSRRRARRQRRDRPLRGLVPRRGSAFAPEGLTVLLTEPSAPETTMTTTRRSPLKVAAV